MSDLSLKSSFSNQIPISTILGIIASLVGHGALFAVPNLPLFSVENKNIKTNPVPIVQLNDTEVARLPDLSPKPTQVPEFPNTPLPNTPILETALALPFPATPTPLPPLPTTSLFLPPDLADKTNQKPEISEIPEIPAIKELPVAKTVPIPPPLLNNPPFDEPSDNSPALPQKDDLQELKRQLETQQEIETEMNVDLNSIPLRSTNDILREFSNAPVNQNPNPETKLPPKDPEIPPNPVNVREFPLLPPTGKQDINPPSEQDLLAMAQENARTELQQRAAALAKNTNNTSDKEATTNYLNWLITINQVEPEKLTLKGKYPKDACLQKLEGSTTYGVLVNGQGEPTSLQLIKSAEYPIFNENARFEISFYEFKKDNPKPYLVTVDFAYNQNICPEQLPPANQKHSQSTNNNTTPPLLDNIPQSVKPSEEKKPDLNPVNSTVSEEKKPDLNPVNSTVSEEKKPDLNPVNSTVSEEKKPDLTPVSEEKKPDLTPVSEEKKPEN